MTNIPPVPDDAVWTISDVPGHKVADKGNQRWRFKNGRLVYYLVYGDNDRIMSIIMADEVRIFDLGANERQEMASAFTGKSRNRES